MLRRGLTSLTIAGVMTLAIAVPAVMADTAERFTYEVHFAEATVYDGNNVYDVVAQYGKSDGTAFNELHYGANIFKDVTCKGKGKKTFPGQVTTFLDGSDPNATIKFAPDLGKVTATGSMTITVTIDDSCTGMETQGASYTVNVSLDLHATTGLTSAKSHTEIKYPDGSKFVDDLKTDSRDADGNFHVGATDFSPVVGNIVHQTDVSVFMPPPAH